MNKVVMIGLDGLSPDLVFKWANELPYLSTLMDQGIYGRIESTVPPLTPPTWTCVLSGKNPGQFGFWDFTYRRDFSYGEPQLVNSKVRDEATESLYHILPAHHKKVAVINVPLTYPPPEIPHGYCLSSFMTPSGKSRFAYPPELKEEITKLIGEYIIDVPKPGVNSRQMNEFQALKKIYQMDQQRFDLLKYFITNKNCDFIFVVIMGTDRIPHLFCRYSDEEHVRYTPHPTLKHVLKDHYKFCDKNIGEVMDLVDEETSLVALSGYSTQRLDGRINLNEWLIQEGYMQLSQRPKALTPLIKADIDWKKTRAWATGYTGQIYLNVQGREKEGIVDPDEYNALLNELSERICTITDQKDNRLETKVFKRKDIHTGKYAKSGPDLFIYFDNCRWNTSELIGYNSIYSYEVPKGQDDGSHRPYGFFLFTGPRVSKLGELSGATLLDIAPTILNLMGIKIPLDMEGRNLLRGKEPGYLKESKEKLKERLRKLGYFTLKENQFEK